MICCSALFFPRLRGKWAAPQARVEGGCAAGGWDQTPIGPSGHFPRKRGKKGAYGKVVR